MQPEMVRMTRAKRNVALASVLAALLLAAAKLIVGLLTRSLGILAEALHSGLDLLAALVTLIAVNTSDKPADEEHPYGHGKIESLSALIEAGLLFVTSGWIIYEGIYRLVGHGPTVEVNLFAIGVMVLSVAVNFGRSRALGRVARRYSSQALEADALHFSTDVYTSLAVIVGLVLVRLGLRWGDPVVALGVAAFIILSAVRLTVRAGDILMDRARAADVVLVRQGIAAVPDLESYSRLRVRRAGSRTFVDLTIRVSPQLPLARAHEVTENLEQEIARRIPDSDVVIHVEPSGYGGAIVATGQHGRLDREDVIRQIKAVLDEHVAQFVSYHEMDADTVGHEPTITFHLVVPENANVKETHNFCDHIEQDIKKLFANARISIHVEPCDRNCTACKAACASRA